MKKKRVFLFFIPLILIIFLAFYLNNKMKPPRNKNSNVVTSGKEDSNEDSPKENKIKTKKIGILTYNMDDEVSKDLLKELEFKMSINKNIKTVYKDCRNDLNTFKENLDSLISEKVDGLLINTNNFESVSYANKKLLNEKIATIYFDHDISKYLDKKNKQIIYMGSISNQAYVYQGELAFDLWTEKIILDKNNDGILQYMKFYLSTDLASGFENDNLEVFTKNDIGVKEILNKEVRSLDEVDNNYISKYIIPELSKTEIIFTNNDSLSVKLINYFKERDKKPAIVGMRASELSRRFIKNKALSASVGLDSSKYSDNLIKALLNKLNGNEWNLNTSYKIHDENLIILDNEKITN